MGSFESGILLKINKKDTVIGKILSNMVVGLSVEGILNREKKFL